jgi:hypothetical protein
VEIDERALRALDLHQHGRCRARLARRWPRDQAEPNLSNSFFHDLMASVLGVAFELSARPEPDIVYLSWRAGRCSNRRG